jgi:hypothetical protein
MKGIASLIKKSAPLLSKALSMTGPIGSVAGSIVESVLGTDDEAEAKRALEANPELLLELKKAEMDNSVELRKAAIEEARIEAQDRQGARDRDEFFLKTTGKRDQNMVVLGWVITGGFFSLTAYLTYIVQSSGLQSINPLLAMLFGTLASSFTAVVNYNYGSSRGSKDKSEAMAAAAKK